MFSPILHRLLLTAALVGFGCVVLCAAEAPAPAKDAAVSPQQTASASAPATTPAKTADKPAEKAATPEKQPELSADMPIEFNNETKDLIARENAELITPQFSVQADQLTLNQKTNIATAEGNVRLSYRASRILTQRAEYDIKAKRIHAEQLRAGLNPLYLKGNSVDGTPEGMVINNATLYFVEPDPYALNLAASSMTILPDPYRVVIKDATFRLGPVPFFYLPSYTQTLNDRPPFRVKLNGGTRKSLGVYGETSIWYTKDPVWAPGVMFDYYQKRGPMYGPMLQYNYTKKEGWDQVGDFKAGFIHDKDPGADDAGVPLPTNRYYYEWTHKGHLTERVDITSVLNWWSDSRVTRDFRQDYWEQNQYPDNFTEITYKGDFYYVDAFSRYQVNDFYGVQQRLPALSFDMVPVQIGKTGIYQQSQVAYSHLVQDAFSGSPSLTDQMSNRYDLYYGVTRPFNPNGWSTITPVTGGRITHYADAVDPSGQYTRFLGQFGLDAEMRMQGDWNVQQDTWDINGLRHILRPVMQYRYIPAASQGASRIPVIDAFVDEDFPQTLDLGNMRNIDQIYDLNTVRVGFENLLQTRGQNTMAARDLVYLNIYQDFSFAENNPTYNGHYSDTYTMLGIKPAQWLQFDVFNTFDSPSLTLNEIRTRTRFKNGDKWHIDLNTDYIQEDSNQYFVQVFYRINERFGVHGLWRYDIVYGGMTEQIYGVSQKLGNSWVIWYELAYREGTEDYGGLSFNVRIDVLAF